MWNSTSCGHECQVPLMLMCAVYTIPGKSKTDIDNLIKRHVARGRLQSIKEYPRGVKCFDCEIPQVGLLLGLHEEGRWTRLLQRPDQPTTQFRSFLGLDFAKIAAKVVSEAIALCHAGSQCDCHYHPSEPSKHILPQSRE